MNNWYVVTGGPSSGKTALLNALAKHGIKIFPETARVYIDQQMEQGLTIDQIRGDEAAFQRKVLEMKIELENSLPPQELIFFDRGIPDSLAYYKFIGIDSDPFLEQAVKNSTYKKVFLLDMLSYDKDYARTESASQAMKIHQLLKSSYEQLNLLVIGVGVMSVKDRVQFILKHI